MSVIAPLWYAAHRAQQEAEDRIKELREKRETQEEKHQDETPQEEVKEKDEA